MNDLKYRIDRVKGMSCPNKYLLTINNILICFADSKKALKNALNYAFTLDESVLENKKIKKIIKKALEV